MRRTGQQHNQAVQAEGDAAVRGRAGRQAVQQRAELPPRLRLTQPDRAEHPLLHFPPVDAQAAACEESQGLFYRLNVFA